MIFEGVRIEDILQRDRKYGATDPFYDVVQQSLVDVCRHPPPPSGLVYRQVRQTQSKPHLTIADKQTSGSRPSES